MPSDNSKTPLVERVKNRLQKLSATDLQIIVIEAAFLIRKKTTEELMLTMQRLAEEAEKQKVVKNEIPKE